MSKVLVDPTALEEAAKWLEVHSASPFSAEAFAADALREVIVQPAEAEGVDVVGVTADVEALRRDAERYRWLLRQAWFQSAFERYDFDDGGIQHRFELCVAEIIDDALQQS